MFWYQARSAVEEVRAPGHCLRGDPVRVERGAGADRCRGRDTRAGRIAAEQQEKAKDLKPYAPEQGRGAAPEGRRAVHHRRAPLAPVLRERPSRRRVHARAPATSRTSASYNTIDLRGSYTLSGYSRIETEFRAPRLFDRRGTLSLVGGWREATQVGFYGTGTGNTSNDDRANYSFRQPYVSATLDLRPTRKVLFLGRRRRVLRVGPAFRRRDRAVGRRGLHAGDAARPGDARSTYLHTQGTAAFDWRTSAGYSRRGGYYGVTYHDFADRDDTYSFRQVDYDVIQHVPLFRDAWVLSLHGRVETTYADDDETIPFFMLPSLGGGSSLRGFSSWRFRDRHSLLAAGRVAGAREQLLRHRHLL